ncbi:MAG: HAD-IC family P-type ATPase [Candidatus Magasanikbacteria bacterium]
MENYHAQSIAQVFSKLQSREAGLSLTEVEKHGQKYGKNELPVSQRASNKFHIFIDQFKSPLILILAFAGVISAFLGESVDAIVIFITVAVNTFIGFIQENKANQALQKLRNLIEYNAVVIRDGKKKIIPGVEVVPGDILLVQAGDKIQADGRIFEASSLSINESTLTGESKPVNKHSRVVKEDAVLGDRTNMAYRGTVVVNGKASMVITATGKNTEIGRIATLVNEVQEDKTPLQIQLQQLGAYIGIIVFIICAGIFILGLLRPSLHHGIVELFQISVAVAVAAIPEGLAISLTVILAIGMQYILKRNALVRKLIAAETLGSVNVICTDKTGTLTEGVMQATHLITARNELSYDELKVLDVEDEDTYADELLAIRIGVLCNDAIVEINEEGIHSYSGDTTDIALTQLGEQVGLHKHELEEVIRRNAEIPFSSEQKYMATAHHIDHETEVYVKGACEVLLSRCYTYENNGESVALNQKIRELFIRAEDILTKKGLRVLALAYKKEDTRIKTLGNRDIEKLTLVGLIAFSDPLRSDVKENIALADRAGIRVIMITGDHAQTAQTIGREIGIPSEQKHVVLGTELEHLSDKELISRMDDACIFARVDPKHKIRIVQALQSRGDVVAMTGDGVNDAPAIKAADIGIAVGSGTDVAKEIADLVILDNSFSTIIAAVSQGRSIYQNIKKVIVYLLASSFAEVVLIVGSIVAGMPLALLPAQILWMNLVHEGFVVMALGFDKGDPENMNEPPRKKHDSIFDPEMKAIIVVISLVSNIVLFSLYVYYVETTGDVALARTLMFIGIGIYALSYIFSIRNTHKMFWQMSLFDNKLLLLALIISWTLMICSVYLPSLQTLLRTVPLRGQHWIVMGSFGLLSVILVEIIKWIFIVRKKHV